MRAEIGFRRGLGLLPFLLSSACVSPAQPQVASSGPDPRVLQVQAVETLPQQIAQSFDDLQAAIGDPTCTSDAQCRTVGVGAKPCGGPQGYLSWSEAGSDPARIAALADRHRTLSKTQNERSGLLSNCQFAPDPGAVCRAAAPNALKRCQLTPAGRAGAV